jgi:eukaryotic-like serine/threonine-protein kinase
VLRILFGFTYALALLVLFVVSSYTAFSLFVRSGVTRAPDLLGLSREEAEVRLSDNGLSWGDPGVPGRYSEAVPEGLVAEQQPAPGSLIKRGKEVKVLLSLGAERLVVPELRGQALQAAEVALGAAGLTVGRSLAVYSPGSQAGTVVEQSPPPNQAVARNTPVDVLLALEGRGQTYVMPDLVYRRFEPVRNFFEQRGFRLRNVRFEPYDGVAEGVILRQSPPAGDPVSPTDTIALVVAGADSAPL